MTNFVCTNYEQDWLGNYQCKEIQELTINPSNSLQLQKLDNSQVNELIIAFAMVFATIRAFRIIITKFF